MKVWVDERPNTCIECPFYKHLDSPVFIQETKRVCYYTCGIETNAEPNGRASCPLRFIEEFKVNVQEDIHSTLRSKHSDIILDKKIEPGVRYALDVLRNKIMRGN